MNYYEDVLGLIGNTPLVKLNRLSKGLKPLILAKMENLNPGFSVKDRIGISMIAAAEREGKLKLGGTIVEVVRSVHLTAVNAVGAHCGTPSSEESARRRDARPRRWSAFTAS